MLMDSLLDDNMQVVSCSEARQGAVVMSLDTTNSLMETVHLLRSPANAAHLKRSLEQAGRGELLSHGLIDPDPADAFD
jgi:antitoxin YefM